MCIKNVEFLGWHGFPPPQFLFSNRFYEGIVLDPPDLNPGSWIGAGKVVFDPIKREFILTARPRVAHDQKRGFAVNIYTSVNGISFNQVASISKEEISKAASLRIHSIEGTQILLDPKTRRWFLFVSVDTSEEFVWGGLKWQTILLSSDVLNGPWKVEKFVLKNDKDFDSLQSRDATIDLVDGRWICLYKAVDSKRVERPAIALSEDGINWRKLGTLRIDGSEQHIFLSGTIFSSNSGPIFVGLETQLVDMREELEDVEYVDNYKIGHGGGPVPNFVAYKIDLGNLNLETIYRVPWTPESDVEHSEHPLLGYSSMVYDFENKCFLFYLEAIDGKLTKRVGLNSTVERLILYRIPLQDY